MIGRLCVVVVVRLDDEVVETCPEVLVDDRPSLVVLEAAEVDGTAEVVLRDVRQPSPLLFKTWGPTWWFAS